MTIISGPGKPLSELAGQHGPIAILGNGPSLPKDRLHEIAIPTFGMNRTWKFPSTYYLALEPAWLGVEYEGPHFLNATTFSRRKTPANHDRGWRVPLYYGTSFSDSIDKGFFPASTGFLSFQVAMALGFKPVHFLGLDLQGAHFDGSPCGESLMEEHHNTYFRIAAKHLSPDDVFICESPDSKCNVFPHSDLADIL